MSVLGLGQIRNVDGWSEGVIIIEKVAGARYRIMAVERILRLRGRVWLEPGDTMTVPVASVLKLGVRSDRERAMDRPPQQELST